MNLKNYIVQRNINDSINEKHNTSYKDNIETSRASIQLNEDKYDEENKTEKYFFNNIIFFTNERNSKKNKTLKNLESAIKGTNINLITFVAEEVEFLSSKNASGDAQPVYTEQTQPAGSKSSGKSDVINTFTPIDDNDLPF